MKPVGLVSVDLKNDEFVIQGLSKAKAGYWITNGHLDRQTVDVADDDLGEAILRASATSEIGVENPKPRMPLPSQVMLLQTFGVKSYGQYMRGTKELMVDFFDTGVVQVSPHRNAGSGEGFVPIVDATEDIDSPDAEVLGKAVREGFERAE